MRVVVGIFAALLTLGLAAFGVVAAQQASGPGSVGSVAALVNHYLPHRQTASAVPAPVSQPAQPALEAPVIKVSATTPAPATAILPSAPAPTPASIPAPAPAKLIVAQNTNAATGGAAPAPTPAPAPRPTASASPWPTTIPECHNPDAVGMSRIVQIDTTGGPAFGTEHFKQYDFLRDKEVVLTFDDGPWPQNTEMVLKALQDNCARAIFFEIGEHATWAPQITKALVDAGMTVGTHTWSHKDLAKNPYAKDIEQAKQEIEMGVSAVHMAAQGGPVAPFFRFPDLQMPPDLLTYLGTRNIATFSADFDTFDFKLRKPEDVVKSMMTKLAKNGKGMVLMHDFQHATAEAMPEIMRQLHAGGYKIVGVVPKAPVTTIAKYDDMVRANDKFSSSNNTRPESSVIQTISQ